MDLFLPSMFLRQGETTKLPQAKEWNTLVSFQR